MLKIAFASTDQVHVNLHFGGSESLVIYDVSPGVADLVSVGQFVRAVLKGENKDKGAAADAAPAPVVEAAPPVDPSQPEPDKVLAKLDFVQDCAAVYAAAIGTSSIKRLMKAGVQPIIVEAGHEIMDLLNEVSLALCHPGALGWVDAALAKANTAAPAADSGPSESRRPLLTLVD
ncbi:MAG TPA: NifB/NifX family molybdenum-iron cluster-binding protein [Patescibacteria group bacterium]|nr:NifB/NifX family molybdenum-iron cluster-binding protein [Patescibacteria group bacterium]